MTIFLLLFISSSTALDCSCKSGEYPKRDTISLDGDTTYSCALQRGGLRLINDSGIPLQCISCMDRDSISNHTEYISLFNEYCFVPRCKCPQGKFSIKNCSNTHRALCQYCNQTTAAEMNLYKQSFRPSCAPLDEKCTCGIGFMPTDKSQACIDTFYTDNNDTSYLGLQLNTSYDDQLPPVACQPCGWDKPTLLNDSLLFRLSFPKLDLSLALLRAEFYCTYSPMCENQCPKKQFVARKCTFGIQRTLCVKCDQLEEVKSFEYQQVCRPTTPSTIATSSSSSSIANTTIMSLPLNAAVYQIEKTSNKLSRYTIFFFV